MSSLADTPLPDAGERQMAIDPARSVVVQAPAGAGKTTLLVERFLQLLAIVERPEEILAITFTTKAATEMRERVRRRLTAADDALGSIVRTRSRQRGWGLEDHPARLHIQTIDSFARTLSARLPLVSGLSAATAITDNPAELHRRAAQRTIHRIHQDQNITSSLLAYIALYNNQVPAATDALAKMLGKREQWLEALARTIGSGAQDSNNLRRELQTTLQALEAEACASLHQRIGSGAMDEFVALSDLVDPDPAGARIRTARLFLPKDQKSLRKRFGKEISHLPAPVQQRLKDLTTELAAKDAFIPVRQLALLPDTPLGDDETRALLDVCITLFTALEDLDTEAGLSGTIDFTEVMLAARRALSTPDGPTDLALAMDYRLQHLLVDEFQDTSTAQFELFRLLTSGFTPGDGRTFFAVGDPMQSIYGFRDADVARFFELQHNGISGLRPENARLQANFRSDERLITWINQTFASVLGNTDEPRIGKVAFAPAVARRDSDIADVQVRQYAAAGDEVTAIIRRIQTLLAAEATSTIAVLVQKRRQLPALLDALAHAGIPWSGRDLEPLAAVPIVRDILSIVTVLSDPGNRIAWFALLRTPFAGLSLPQLESLATVPDLQAWVMAGESDLPGVRRLQTALAYGARQLHELSPREILEGFLFRCGAFASCDGPALENALLCLDRIERLGSRGLHADEVRLSLDGLFASSGAPARVEILTAHKAKGLEWDHVILPFLADRGGDDEKPPVRWQSVDNDSLVLSLKGGHAETWLKAGARDRLANEKGRLLYVACTRARHTLSLSWTVKNEKPGNGTLAALVAGSATVECMPAVSPTSTAGAVIPPAAILPRLRRLPDAWAWQHPEPDGDFGAGDRAREETAPEVATDPAAAAIGDCVHLALARMADTPLPRTSGELVAQLQRDWELACIQQGVAGQAVRHCAAQAAVLLDRVIADPTGRWLLGRFPESDVESEYTVLLDGHLVTARFDRLLVADGVRWIIDYKSTRFAGDEPPTETLLATEVDRYRPQLALYRRIAQTLWPEPVRTALYFTALPRFVPVD